MSLSVSVGVLWNDQIPLKPFSQNDFRWLFRTISRRYPQELRVVPIEFTY